MLAVGMSPSLSVNSEQQSAYRTVFKWLVELLLVRPKVAYTGSLGRWGCTKG